MYVRKAIALREEIYQALKKETGEEGVSERINEILYKALFKEKKSLFGTMEKTEGEKKSFWNNGKDRYIRPERPRG
jgi:predicted CopG family antitoxin